MAALPATPPVRCADCSTEIPPSARFCPRCGRAARATGSTASPPAGAAPTDLGKLPSPIPVAGILFLVALIIGPAAVVAGIAMSSAPLLYGGIAVAVAVVILLLLGLVF